MSGSDGAPAGWGVGNKAFLREQVGTPLGLLARDDDGPAGWVAVAPRSAYPRLASSPITASGAGPGTWSVTCFFVHRRARGQGLATTLLSAAIDFAAAHGTLGMFLDAGFALVDRRGTRRALVRKEIR